jgi:hypothetical protein
MQLSTFRRYRKPIDAAIIIVWAIHAKHLMVDWCKWLVAAKWIEVSLF